MNCFRIFTIVLGATLGALSASAKDYIVGGQEVGDLDPIHHSTVGLYSPSADGSGGALCTASLIGKDIAVTAAHCVHPGGPRPVLIFGKDLHSPGAPKRPVEAIAINPQWQRSAGKGMDQGDIALVKFPNGIPNGYRKVSTVGKDSEIKTQAEATLAGYGISDARTRAGAGQLRKTNVVVAQSRPGKSEMILDQSHGHGACHGDSGGPAFIRQNGRIVLAGITNRSYPDRAPDDCGHKVVYTKLPAYRSWIQKSEKKLESMPTAQTSVLAKNDKRWSVRKKMSKKTTLHSVKKSRRAKV